MSVKIIMELGYSDEDVITLSRTFGYALSRIAAAEANSFRQHFIDPLEGEALDADQVAARLEQAVPFLLELQGRLVDHVLRRHLVVAQEQEIVLGATTRTQLLAAGFIDLVGFTRTSGDLDPAELGELITTFETLCLETCSDFGVQVVKVIGDAIMFVDSDPTAALKAASAIVSDLSTHLTSLTGAPVSTSATLFRWAATTSVAPSMSRLVSSRSPTLAPWSCPMP